MSLARLAAVVLAAVIASPASAASLIEKNFWLSGPNYHGVLPSCQDMYVISIIAKRFAETDREYWHSGLTLDYVEHQREIAFEPWGPDYIPRRFCSAGVISSDGRRRELTYAIGEDLGEIGATWGVEWCVNGLDRNLAYAPDCKMAKP